MLNITTALCKYHNGLSRHAIKSGFSIERKNGNWVYKSRSLIDFVSEEQAQAIIDVYDPIPETRAIKLQELKDEFVKRVSDIFPAITTFEQVDLMVEQLQSTAVGARAPTVRIQQVIEVYMAAKPKVSEINALTDQDEIWNYNIKDW